MPRRRSRFLASFPGEPVTWARRLFRSFSVQGHIRQSALVAVTVPAQATRPRNKRCGYPLAARRAAKSS
jgi:hypothetical protein